MSSITPVRDPVAEPLVALLDLFGAHADALRFPDIDHSTLAGLADEVRDAAAEVSRCELVLAQARQTLDERQAALRARAERGLAYAKIYAQEDVPMKQRLDAIDLSPRRAPPKRGGAKRARATRARRTKPEIADPTVTELPFDPSQTESPRATVA